MSERVNVKHWPFACRVATVSQHTDKGEFDDFC